MFELKVLAAFIDSRKEWELGDEFLTDISPMGRAVLSEVRDYYTSDEDASSVDEDILVAALKRRFNDVPKHRRDLQDYLTELQAVDTSSVNVTKELLASESDRRGALLAEAIMTRDSDLIDKYLSDYSEIRTATSLTGGTGESYNAVHLDDLEDIYSADNLIKVAPPALNERLRGGLIRGQHIVVGAMPEVGKTLLGLNMNAGFIRQDLKTLHIVNEDPVPELVLRLLSNLSGIKVSELFKNKELVMQRAFERGYKNVTFEGLDPGSIPQIDALLRKDDYDVLIVDQLRNLTAKSENNTVRLEAAAQGIRNLARRHNVLAVSMVQAAESARDKLVLNSGDVDGSNIGIPGACDVMVMAGVNDDYYQRDLRKLTLTKNKRGGIHDNFTVSVDRERSRVMNYS